MANAITVQNINTGFNCNDGDIISIDHGCHCDLVNYSSTAAESRFFLGLKRCYNRIRKRGYAKEAQKKIADKNCSATILGSRAGGDWGKNGASTNGNSRGSRF